MGDELFLGVMYGFLFGFLGAIWARLPAPELVAMAVAVLMVPVTVVMHVLLG